LRDRADPADRRMTRRVATIPAGHPCLPGHFPGRPIVPAVVILEEVRILLADTFPDRSPVAIDYCKFQDFVLPDQGFEMTLSIAGEGGAIDFACHARSDGRLLAKGRIRLEPERLEPERLEPEHDLT
jgi:3-hydroxymyristoyl/3-hydroxydecanoyl-(acyl carrier protein) dehydratase